MDHKRRALREEFRQLTLAYLRPFEDWLTERGIAFCYVVQPYTSWAGDSVLSIAGRAGERLPLEIVHNKDRLVELATELNQRLGLSSEEIGRMTGPAEDQPAADSEPWDQLRDLLGANERRLARAEAGAREQAGAGNLSSSRWSVSTIGWRSKGSATIRPPRSTSSAPKSKQKSKPNATTATA